MRSSRRGRWNSSRCGCRCRRSTNSTTAASSQAASNPATLPPATRSSSCPLARSPGSGASKAGRRRRSKAPRPRAARSASRSTASCSSNAAMSSPMSESVPRDTQPDPRAHFLAARQAARQRRADPGPARHAREPRHRGRDREGGRSRRTVERRDQVDRAQPCRRDRYLAGAADRRRSLYRQSPHRTAGDRGQRPHRRRRAGAVGRCRTTRDSRRHRAGGIGAASRRTFGALSPPRRGGLADRPAGLRQIDAGARAGTPAVQQRRLAGPARRRYACAPASTAILDSRRSDRSENIRRLAEVATHLARNGHIAIVAAVSPSREDRAAARRSPTPRSAKSMSRRRPRSARAAIPRAITPRRAPAALPAFTGIGNDYQPPLDCELDDRYLDALG